MTIQLALFRLFFCYYIRYCVRDNLVNRNFYIPSSLINTYNISDCFFDDPFDTNISLIFSMVPAYIALNAIIPSTANSFEYNYRITLLVCYFFFILPYTITLFTLNYSTNKTRTMNDTCVKPYSNWIWTALKLPGICRLPFPPCLPMRRSLSMIGVSFPLLM